MAHGLRWGEDGTGLYLQKDGVLIKWVSRVVDAASPSQAELQRHFLEDAHRLQSMKMEWVLYSLIQKKFFNQLMLFVPT